MVTSAGLDEFEPFTDITVDAWDRMIAVNLTGTFHCLQAAIPDMLAARLGPDRDDLVVERAVGRRAHGALRRVEGRRDRAHQGAGRRARAARHHREHDPAGFIDTPMARRAEARGDLPSIERHRQA